MTATGFVEFIVYDKVVGATSSEGFLVFDVPLSFQFLPFFTVDGVYAY